MFLHKMRNKTLEMVCDYAEKACIAIEKCQWELAETYFQKASGLAILAGDASLSLKFAKLELDMRMILEGKVINHD